MTTRTIWTPADTAALARAMERHPATINQAARATVIDLAEARERRR